MFIVALSGLDNQAKVLACLQSVWSFDPFVAMLSDLSNYIGEDSKQQEMAARTVKINPRLK